METNNLNARKNYLCELLSHQCDEALKSVNKLYELDLSQEDIDTLHRNKDALVELRDRFRIVV